MGGGDMPATMRVFKNIPRFPEGERKVLLERWPCGEFTTLGDDGETFSFEGPLTSFNIMTDERGYSLCSTDGGTEPVKKGRPLAEVLP
jgi:hypothetical protein